MRTLWRNLAAAALASLIFSSAAWAAGPIEVPKSVSGDGLIAEMQIQFDAMDPISPTRDVAAYLWQTYSVSNLPANRELAGAVILSAIAKPQTIPALSSALEKISAGRKARQKTAQQIVGQLRALAQRYKNSPEDFHAPQALIAPLRESLSKRVVQREVPAHVRPFLSAIFDGAMTLGPPDSSPLRSPSDLPSSLRQVAQRGAGTRGFGRKPGKGGVKPIDKRSRLKAWLLIPLLKKASAIRVPEPLVLSKEDLQKLHQGRRIPSGTASRKSTKEQANKNFATAAAWINEQVKAGRDFDIEMLMQLNIILRRNFPSKAKVAAPGKIRVPNWARSSHRYRKGWFIYAAPKDVPKYLADFMIWYQANKDKLHPIEFAAMTYQQLIRIHPFGDANGRTIRLAMDFILQRYGYPPAVFQNAKAADAVHRSTNYVIRNVARGVINAAKKIK